MAFLNDLNPVIILVSFFVLFIGFSISMAVFSLSPGRIIALKTQNNIPEEQDKLTKYSGLVFLIVALIWYLLALMKFGIDSTIGIFLGLMIAYQIYRYISNRAKKKNTTKYSIFFGKEYSSTIINEISKQYSQIVFLTAARSRPSGFIIIEPDEAKKLQLLTYVKSKTELYEDLTDIKFEKALLKNQITLYLSGIISIVILVAFFLVTLS